MLILTTIIVTIIAVLLLMNFLTGEKKIERDLKRHYSIEEPQFVRSVGALLGPAFLDGNNVEALINGDKIFTEMLSAIKSAKKLGLGIAGVDLLQSDRGPLVMEVNSSPGLEGIEGATGIDIAGKIIEYVERNEFNAPEP